MAKNAPSGLGAGGRRLWAGIVAVHDLDVAQEAQLLEACRAKDRLDKLDAVLRGDVATWVLLSIDQFGTVAVVVDRALDKANATANVMKQLLAACRLPDEVTGKRPNTHRPHGAQRPSVPGGQTRDRLKAV